MSDQSNPGRPASNIPTGQEIAAAQQRLTKDLTQRQFASLQVAEMIKGGLKVEADKVIPLVRALHTFLTEQQPS